MGGGGAAGRRRQSRLVNIYHLCIMMWIGLLDVIVNFELVNLPKVVLIFVLQMA